MKTTKEALIERMNEIENPFLTTKDVAKILGVSYAKVRRLNLKPVEVFGKRLKRFTRESILNFFESA